MQQTVELAKKHLTSSYNKLSVDQRLKFWVVTVGVLTLCALTYAFLAVGWPKFSRAEVFFAECVREMLLSGDPVTPAYHGTPFFDKPILMYWLIGASYLSFGVSHVAARIPSILAALVTVALTAVSGRHLFGPRAGTMAAAMLGSSFMFMSFAAYCMSDMLLVMFDTITLVFLYLATERTNKRSIYFWIAALSMGLAFLTKGPVGIALPALAYSIYLTVTRQWQVVRPIQTVLPCTAIILAAASPWFLSAYRENGAGALSYFFIRENFQRFAGSTYDTHKPIYFMLVSLLGGMLPWSIFLPAAAMKSWKERTSTTANKKNIYLWIWVATVTIFFSLSRGKIDYYALPVYPAACILAGAWLTQACDDKTKFVRILSVVAAALLSLAAIVSPVVLIPCLGPAVGSWFLMPFSFAVCAAGMILCLSRQEYRKAWKLVFVTVCMVTMAVSLQFLPWLTTKQAVLSFVPELRKSNDEESRIGVHAKLANWIDEITFQTGREPLPVKDNAMAARFVACQKPGLLLIPATDYKTLPEELQAKAQVVDTRPFIGKSINPGYLIKHKGTPETIDLLLVRTGNNI